MPEDMDDNETTDEEFAGIVNSNDWTDKTRMYKVVEFMTFAGITVGIVALAAAAIGGAVWVWQKVL